MNKPVGKRHSGRQEGNTHPFRNQTVPQPKPGFDLFARDVEQEGEKSPDTSPNESMIRMFNVTKMYGNQPAIQDITLEVVRGELLFISGPSGAGKSTLIKLILCEETASQGEILVDNVNLKRLAANRVPHYRRRIGVIFQDFKLIPTRTVFQNVALRLEIEGARQDYIGKKVRYILKRVGLSGREQAYPLQLSGGEQQRVAIARAFVGDPDIILADEPTGNLDLDLTRSVMGLLEEINQAGATVLVATHSGEILRNTSHRIIRLERGRLVEQ